MAFEKAPFFGQMEGKNSNMFDAKFIFWSIQITVGLGAILEIPFFLNSGILLFIWWIFLITINDSRGGPGNDSFNPVIGE